jgi:PKD repeat protein
VGGDGGLWRTDNSGFDFVNCNSNLNLTQFYDVAIDPDDPMKVWGGAQDNSSSRRNGNQLWNVTAVTGDGFMNVIDPKDRTRVFQTSYPSGGTPSVYRSLSGGAVNTFNRLLTTGIGSGENFPWVTPLAILPGTIFVGSQYVYRADTGNPHASFSWTKISPDVGAGSALVVIHPYPTPSRTSPRAYTRPGAYTGSSSGQIWRTKDVLAAAPSWTNVTSNYPGGYVSDIAVDPLDAERVYVTRGGFNQSRLWRSTNGGASWDGTATGLPNVPANAVAVDPLDGRRVFVGNDVGVFESIDYGATFQPFSLGLPLGVVVTDLEIDDSPYTLVAGTYGRGAWRVDLLPVPNQPPSAQFTETTSGLKVGFEDRSSDSDGRVESWLWSFGDGTVSTERHPVKTYAAAGRYQVTLIVTDDRAASSTSTTEVVVSGAARRRRR